MVLTVGGPNRVGSQSPLVRSVVEGILSRIQRGELAVGRSLPSERQLVEEFGVSRGTIRLAVKEMQEIGLIDCKPNCKPIVKSPTETPIMGQPLHVRHIAIWLWPCPSHYSASSILKGIQSVDVPSDVRLVVASAPTCRNWEASLESEAAFLKTAAGDRHTAGVILYYLGGERNLSALQTVRSAGIPLVFVDRLSPGQFDADCVGSDNESAAKACVEHLIELNHRRIALISNEEEVSTVLGREAGYRRALREAGIPVTAELICRDSIDDPNAVGRVVDRLLKLDPRPTAVVGVNDHVALAVCDALQARGVSVPKEMSVLGFDGLLRWVPGGGFLTSACQDFERMGQLATEILLERIDGRCSTAYRHMFLHASLMVRHSTAVAVERGSPFLTVNG